MKKNVLLSSIVLSAVTLVGTPMIANASSNIKISNVDDSKINIPGIKITKSNSNKNNNSNTQNQGPYERPAPPPGSMGGNPTGVVGAKPVNIPNAKPIAQSIQMNSYNDIQEKATEKKQGQIPYAPPTINQETIQKWNQSTINELEEQGQAATKSKYSNFRSNPHGYR